MSGSLKVRAALVVIAVIAGLATAGMASSLLTIALQIAALVVFWVNSGPLIEHFRAHARDQNSDADAEPKANLLGLLVWGAGMVLFALGVVLLVETVWPSWGIHVPNMTLWGSALLASGIVVALVGRAVSKNR